MWKKFLPVKNLLENLQPFEIISLTKRVKQKKKKVFAIAALEVKEKTHLIYWASFA